MESRRRLLEIAEKTQMGTLEIVEWIKAGNISPIRIANALQEQLRKWESVNTLAVAEEWVGLVDDLAKQQLTNRLKGVFGVDTAFIFDDESVRYAASLMSSSTANKIVDVPRWYIQNITEAAIQNFQGIPFPEGRSLTQQFMFLNNETFERARTIARHQTSVINAAVNQARQTAIGIEEYYWSSSHDERTVGNPAGLYPKGNQGHGDHWARDYRNNGNKSYRWDEPFKDGLPGQAYNCRCVAIAKINTAKLNPERVFVGDAAMGLAYQAA